MKQTKKYNLTINYIDLLSKTYQSEKTSKLEGFITNSLKYLTNTNPQTAYKNKCHLIQPMKPASL